MLLSAVAGEVVVLDEVDDPHLFGGVVESAGGLLFAMPAGCPAGEREFWVRVLLAHREGYDGRSGGGFRGPIDAASLLTLSRYLLSACRRSGTYYR
ncbi:hypothetical protein [Streptomyces reniochalinae]